MHVSLCTGVGGLDLPFGAPDEAWDIDPRCRDVLAARFPTTSLRSDWTALEALDDRTTLITGGLPCQPVSIAGRQRGANDDRYLFDDLVRLLRSSDVRPFLVLENVRGFLHPRSGPLLWRLASALADLGYVGQWEVVRASEAGACHQRERWFCAAAHPDGGGWPTWATPTPQDEGREEPGDRAGVGAALRASRYGAALEHWEQLTRPMPVPLNGENLTTNPAFVEWMMGFPAGWVTDVIADRENSVELLGNAVVPQQAELALTRLKERSLTHRNAIV